MEDMMNCDHVWQPAAELNSDCKSGYRCQVCGAPGFRFVRVRRSRIIVPKVIQKWMLRESPDRLPMHPVKHCEPSRDDRETVIAPYRWRRT